MGLAMIRFCHSWGERSALTRISGKDQLSWGTFNRLWKLLIHFRDSFLNGFGMREPVREFAMYVWALSVIQ